MNKLTPTEQIVWGSAIKFLSIRYSKPVEEIEREVRSQKTKMWEEFRILAKLSFEAAKEEA